MGGDGKLMDIAHGSIAFRGVDTEDRFARLQTFAGIDYGRIADTVILIHIGAMIGEPIQNGTEEDIGAPDFGVKPTVPLKRRPIVPKNKLPRPNIIERINWTAAGTLSVALTEDTPAVVTIIERDGTLRSYVSDAYGVEIADAAHSTGNKAIAQTGWDRRATPHSGRGAESISHGTCAEKQDHGHD